MREFKFRARDKAMKRMLMNIGVHPNMCCINEDYESDEDGAYTISPLFTNYAVMQFTGLLDKNGVEIYEGDVVVADWHWDEPHAITLPDDYYDFYEFCIYDKMTVIGNIHQHPELLK